MPTVHTSPRMVKSFVKVTWSIKSQKTLMSLLKSFGKCNTSLSYLTLIFTHEFRFHIVYGKTAKRVFQLLITYLQVLPLKPSVVKIPPSLSPPHRRASLSPTSSAPTLPSSSPLSTPSTTSPSSSFQNIRSDDSATISMSKHTLEDNNDEDAMDTSEDPLANLPARQRRNKKAKEQTLSEQKGKAKGFLFNVMLLHIF